MGNERNRLGYVAKYHALNNDFEVKEVVLKAVGKVVCVEVDGKTFEWKTYPRLLNVDLQAKWISGCALTATVGEAYKYLKGRAAFRMGLAVGVVKSCERLLMTLDLFEAASTPKTKENG